jgi:sugar-specific transcriptional regulator TrmB
MDTGTPLTIAKTTGLKRPTVYLVLESLRRKRLVGITFQGKKTFYTAEPPSRIVRYLEESRQTALELLPLLKARAQKTENKPTIRFYDQPEDIEDMWYELADNVKYYNYISNTSVWSLRFPKIDAYFTKRAQSGDIITLRGLVVFDPANLPYVNKIKHDIRVLPEKYKFNYNVTIWETGVALYSFVHSYMLVITDSAFTEVFHSLFELSWKISMDPQTFIKNCRPSTKTKSATKAIPTGQRKKINLGK